MKNPYTTILGYGSIAVAVIQYLMGFASSHVWPPSVSEVLFLVIGVMGVFAKDGGH
jgi:hypothetical protein